MIKHIIFDLDGVLVDSRDLHFKALNMSLGEISPECIIEKEEHLSTYDGLPTTKKLKLLTENKNLNEDLYEKVWELKQQKALSIINEMPEDFRLKSILKNLSESGYTIHVASNSIKKTMKLMLIRLGILEYIDEIYSNQDVKNPKPNPEMYMLSMIKAGVSPKETIIIEDSHIGRKAVVDSGAHLCAVSNPSDVTLELIESKIKLINSNCVDFRPKWQGGDMNVLIPMAGAGTRFQSAGYTFPKPLIDVKGKPMIQVIVENLNIDAKHIFITQKSHYEKYHLKSLMGVICPNSEIVQVEGLTEGAACTTLLARDFIDNDKPLLIANSDQFVDWDSNEFMYSVMGDDVDGAILTFKNTHPKWSYAKLDSDGFVSEVAEKKPISDNATVGIYVWKKGSDYVKYADMMIAKNKRINNEFYVCPVFNEAIEDGKRIKIFEVDKMWGLGTPEDLNYFMENYKK